MGKVSGSYESVVRGVSEQNPQSRRSGQHFAQVNMVSDPVRGLARRHGSFLQDEQIIGAGALSAGFLSQTAGSRASHFFVGGTEYDLIARTTASVDAATEDASFAFCFNKETRQFIPVELGTSDLVASLVAGGVSAMANVGRYLYLAGNSIIPASTDVDAWGNATNKAMLVGWIRKGAYAQTFSVTLTKSDGSALVGEYKTKTSSYPNLLDTSDILASDTEYQKKVNDRVNAYNSAATAWIGEAAADITPENIAAELMAALITAGVDPGDISVSNGYILINSTDYKEIAMDDSGDGSLVRGVGNVIDNLDLVSSRHYVGKVVKVEPENTTGDPVYLKAFAKNDIDTGFAEVVWRESAGFSMTPSTVFCMATVEDGTLYIAGSATELETMSGITEVPDFKGNTVGDELSSPLPTFFGRRIDYMGVFQDRLIVGAGSTLMFSRPGDYLNWFRKSVLSIQDDDPWEGYALGAEDDTIKFGVLYDRSLLLYGERFQYIVSGRTQFTPQSANVAIASSYEGAIDASPRPTGNFVFYAKHSGVVGKETTSMHQMQPGVVADVSDSYPASQQLDTYLNGKPVEIVVMTSPNMVLLRTTGDRRRMYTYSYLDNPNSNERLFDSWSHWSWVAGVGDLIGISRHKSDILIYTVKSGNDRDNVAKVWVACEKFVRDTDLSEYPYLDSLRPLTDYLTPIADGYMNENMGNSADAAVAFGTGVTQKFLGDRLDELERFQGWYPTMTADMFVGWDFDAYVTPTNPYAKDRNDQALLSARLTLTKVTVALSETGGMGCTVTSRGSTRTSLNFTGRIIGSPTNQIGTQPIVTTSVTAFIGGEVKECTYTLSALRWLPLTINSIDWQGQLFFNTRRV